jgi:hypothetical protein
LLVQPKEMVKEKLKEQQSAFDASLCMGILVNEESVAERWGLHTLPKCFDKEKQIVNHAAYTQDIFLKEFEAPKAIHPEVQELLACDMQNLFDLLVLIISRLESVKEEECRRWHVIPADFGDQEAQSRCRTLVHEACWSLTDKVQVLRRIKSVAELESLVNLLKEMPADFRIVVWIDENMSLHEGFSQEDCSSLSLLLDQLQLKWTNTLFLLTSNKNKMKKLPTFKPHVIEGTTAMHAAVLIDSIESILALAPMFGSCLFVA